MKQRIKDLRVTIDGIAQLTKELKPLSDCLAGLINSEDSIVSNQVQIIRSPNYNSKEIEKTVDSLLLAKAWLGKTLQQLGEETPYSNDGKRKTVEDIEPTKDVSNHKEDVKNLDWNEREHIEKVDWLRQEIQLVLDQVIMIGEIDLPVTVYNDIVFKQVAVHLTEARFHLGFELGRIRDNK
jgi:uncharacterized protein (DUF342 family)